MPTLLFDLKYFKKTQSKNKAIKEKLHKVLINILTILSISILWIGIHFRNLGPLKG